MEQPRKTRGRRLNRPSAILSRLEQQTGIADVGIQFDSLAADMVAQHAHVEYDLHR